MEGFDWTNGNAGTAKESHENKGFGEQSKTSGKLHEEDVKILLKISQWIESDKLALIPKFHVNKLRFWHEQVCLA